jgi:hypothetical protein
MARRSICGWQQRWRSFDPVVRLLPLPGTTVTLLDAFFDWLERPAQFGETLVRHALGDLAAARNGLAEDELLEVLAQDGAVRASLQALNPNAPPIDPKLPLPTILWARPAAELERLLIERVADGAELLTFYHGQVRQVVDAQALQDDEARARHQDLATYFAQQPWQLTDTRWNERKLAELATQQAAVMRQAAMATADANPLRTTLTDGRYLVGTLTVAGVAAVIGALGWLPGDASIQRLSAAIRAGAVVLGQAPEELNNQVQGRGGDPAILHDLPARTRPYVRLRAASLLPADPALQHTFTGHTSAVQACAFSLDGHLALSTSNDRTLRLWEVATGESVRTFTGHTSGVEGCAFSPDGQLLLSTSFNGTLRLWEVATGESVRTFTGHTSGVTACAFSPDGRLALSASWDQTLRLWKVATGTEMTHWRTDTGLVCCAWSSDPQQLLAGDESGGVHFLELVGVALPRESSLSGPMPVIVTPGGSSAGLEEDHAAGRRPRHRWRWFGRR